jgi:putative effector of murein hydrolase
VGSLVAIVAAVGIGALLGLSPDLLLSLMPKSVTTPIAMGISEEIGGIPSLTAALVVLTGIIGVVSAVDWLNLLRVRDDAARGFAIGLSCHGIGTARALQISEEAGALSGLAMGLNGILTAILIPLLVRLLGW